MSQGSRGDGRLRVNRVRRVRSFVAALLVLALLPLVAAGQAGAEQPALVPHPDEAVVLRGSVVDVDVLVNDLGPGGVALVDPVLEIEVPPANGSVDVVDLDGAGGRNPVLRYRPALDASSADSLEYRVTDSGATGTAQVLFAVENAAPKAVDDRGSVRSSAGSTILVPVLVNDSDVDGGTLVITSVSAPGHGGAVVAAGQVRYDPVDSYVGSDSFAYTVTDGQGGVATATVRITVEDPTSPMLLRPDTVRATSGVRVTVPVLNNDDSGGRDPLTLIAASAPRSGGSADVDPGGRSVTYTAPRSFVGSDSFSYTVRDGRGNQATGQVSAVVSKPAPPPVVTATFPGSVVVGNKYRVPVKVTGFDASGLVAELQSKTPKGWARVARRKLGAEGGRIKVRASTDLAGLGPTRTRAIVDMRVVVRRPNSGTVVSNRAQTTARALVKISVSGRLKRKHVRYSYRPGCPVGPASLRRMSINYWDYAGTLKRGTLIVRSDSVRDLRRVFARAFNEGFRIKKMRPTNTYYKKGRRSPTASDKAAMRAGNTSAFNCRSVVGNPTKRSAHSYGVAIDINTFQNPYLVTGGYYPRGAGRYLRRSPCRKGMICPGGPVATAMSARGWLWGARWSRPDYQHFSSNGG